MAKQYWVGEFYVDLSRNQISQLGQSQTLPPKALQVLTLLAENRGKVVSYDELLDKVWANSVVTPNTLQRCVAQLRKALGEDSKAQGIIKTHAKQGYSLECDVNWSVTGKPASESNIHTPIGNEPQQDNTELQTSQQQTSSQSVEQSSTGEREKKANNHVWKAAMVAMLILAAGIFQWWEQEPEFQFGELRYLTATDDKEYGGKYSSDGKYILFHRYYDKLCINNIWAKNAETMEEIQLTKDIGTYEGQSLSPDGKTLAFIQRQDCTKPVTQNFCFKLMSMDFEAALREPQTATELLHCQDSKIKMPTWIDDKHVVMLQKEIQQPWRLIRFSVVDKTSTTLYQFSDGNILHYAFSPELQRFAVTSMKKGGTQYIEMLSTQGELISSYPIEIPVSAPRHMIVRPQFVPKSDKLIFSYRDTLYSLSYQGQINQKDFQFNDGVGAPYFHPDASRLLLIKGRYDSDVARISLPEARQSGEQGQRLMLTAFERSFYSEDYAKYQPNGEHIAFASRKTGTGQVWLLGQTGATLISHFGKGTGIDNLHWDKQGQNLLVLANLELYHLSLTGEASVVDFPYPVIGLYDWDSEQNTVIANIMLDGLPKFVQIELDTLAYKTLSNKFVMWAAKNTDGTLVFTDHMDRFWQKQPGAVEDSMIQALAEQGSSKRFVVSQNQLYGINKDNQLWSYDLEAAHFELLTAIQEDIDYLTDASDNELLLSFVVAAKKEVVELSVKN